MTPLTVSEWERRRCHVADVLERFHSDTGVYPTTRQVADLAGYDLATTHRLLHEVNAVKVRGWALLR